MQPVVTQRRGPGGAILVAVLVAAGSSACAVVDPQLAPQHPHHAWGLGLSGGIVTDADEPDSRLGGPNPMVGIDFDYRHENMGLQSGLRVHGEGRAVRTAWLAEFQFRWMLEFGVGMRLGWLSGTPYFNRPFFAADAVFSVGLPIALGRGLALVPQLRPGFRITRNPRGNADLRGFHEFAVMLRWTFDRF